VVFRDVASLNYQAAVFVHGVRVGSVDDIKIRTAEDDVLVRINVNTQKSKIPVGSRFMILPNGVVGAKYIEIMMPEPSKQQTAWLTEKSVVEGDDPVRPEIVVTELVKKLGSLDFSQMQDKLVQSLTKMSSLADHVNNLSNKMLPVAAHATATADSVKALAQEMRAPVNQMHQILDQKHPLMHMMFGRPGHLKDKDKTEMAESSADKVTTESKPQKKHHHFLGL
jgi:ABC-type transporter Mla subunit MlaD